ncbi:Phosphatidylinositol transfer protein SEC14 and related proteins protein [Dioscorea alata]|uniref:Phosphatidylinositol transfer protein SEC14 and related proteins protein n=1 Tax=Dioscorea alata TaxID=55571 RepID=A0ACB7USH1_DIOAL|nr:Phosphatidylinositol transfer protein SEC14 and related proteins protein [Dioscorea alata]
MAEETRAKPTEEVVVVPPAPEKMAEQASAQKEEPAELAPVQEESAGESAAVVIEQSMSFKEESNVVADLKDTEKKALEELKQLIHAALAANEFAQPPPPPAVPKEEKVKAGGPADEVVEEKTVEAIQETIVPVVASSVEDPAPPTAVEEKIAVAIEETTIPVDAPAGGDKIEVNPDPAPEQVVGASASASAPAPAPAPASASASASDPAPVITGVEPEEVFIWGVPLLGDEKSDTVLLKFLRARDFKAKDAFTMIKNTVIWRKTFGIESLLDENLEFPEMEKVVFMHGFDKEGHPVCYNVYGEFQDKDLYAKAFGDDEKRMKFLKWRIQFLEKGIRQLLDFSPGKVCTMVQVTDLKNSPGPAKRDLRQATDQALTLLQDNFPEFAAKQVFIHVPWWYLAFNRMISPFLTQRTKSKFVFAGPSKSAETLFKYIAPEQVPVQYGGLSKENNPDFTTADTVTEMTIKPSSKQTVEIPVTETCTLVWELRVLGWDVTYVEEFVPSAEDSYTVIVRKARKMITTDEPVVKNFFKIGEPGKIVLTIDNNTSKKKKLLYRYKVKTTTRAT